jgi:hypothetical protein
MDFLFSISGLVSGIVLLGISFTKKITGVLRIIAFVLGLIGLTHVLVILDDFLYRMGTKDEGFSVMGSLYESITSQDLEVNTGRGVGRVYLRPRIPMIRDGVRVNVQGNPGSKIVYWPIGGNGIGGRNDDLNLHGISLQDLRTRALGVGVTVLDEQGKGLAVTEEGVGELLYREVYNGEGSTGGPIQRIRLAN